MKKIVAIGFCVLFVACAPNPKMPSGNNININNALLEKRYSFVPQDIYLQSHDWYYQISTSKKDGFYLQNHEIAKTFLLAHNAQKIILIGNKRIINEYKDYFKNNGVSAKIQLQPSDSNDSNGVDIVFFHTTSEDYEAVDGKFGDF